jgi:hypothetical protein
MSMRYQAGFLTASYFPLKVADAPTIGTLSNAGATSLSITFTAPSDVGGGAITGYIAVAIDSSSGATLTGTGASSPVTISGLTTGNTYTAKVAATNAFGSGPLSAASNSAVPALIPFSQSYTTPGSYTFIAPAGYSQLNVIAIGAGGAGGMGGGGTAGGGGGGYAQSLNLSVTPGSSYAVVVGTGGNEGPSTWFVSTSGGASSFNASIIGNGGTGAGNNGTRMAGGTASGGNTLNLTGGYGGASTEAGGNGPTGGGGGFTNSGTFFAGGTANQLYGGNGGAAVSSGAGVNGSNYGGGGGGGNGRANTTPASNCIGANGAVFIYYP